MRCVSAALADTVGAGTRSKLSVPARLRVSAVISGGGGGGGEKRQWLKTTHTHTRAQAHMGTGTWLHAVNTDSNDKGSRFVRRETKLLGLKKSLSNSWSRKPSAFAPRKSTMGLSTCDVSSKKRAATRWGYYRHNTTANTSKEGATKGSTLVSMVWEEGVSSKAA